MKKLTTIIFFALGAVPFAFSQVTMTVNGTSVTTGSQYNYQALHPLGQVGAESMELLITNSGSSDMEFNVERCKIVDVPGWAINSTEWASDDPLTGIHYNANTMTGECWTTLQSIAIAPGEVVRFKDYLTSTDVSCALYRYYVWEAGVSRIDSVDVEYCRTSLNVGELGNSELLIYPNPSADFVSLKGVGGDLSSMKITNVSGQEVMHIEEVPATIDVRSFPEGHYTVSFVRNDGVIITRRMTILR